MTKTKEKKITMIDFEELYGTLGKELSGNQKRLSIESVLGVYYGMSKDGFFRISFMSSRKAPNIESTRLLRITQGSESEGVYWTCFDLLQHDAQKVFFTFCESLIEAIEGISEEKKALDVLKTRYITWKALFKRECSNRLTREELQGLFGELYFLNKYMIPKYGTNEAIRSWSGPDAKSKDYSIKTDWYEIKTIGANSVTVKISSLSQLTSEHEGHLAVIRVEAMSEQYDNEDASIGAVFTSILSKICDESIEAIFLSKLGAYGFDISDESFMSKYEVKSMNLYMVNEEFPRLTEANINKPEVCDVEYSLIVNSLLPYMED